jgi:endoglucanase
LHGGWQIAAHGPAEHGTSPARWQIAPPGDSLGGMKILKELCSVPTAPFAEQHVVRYVEQFVKARKGLRLSKDSHGNLLVELPSRSKRPRWVFGAHMDHPGFVAEKMLGPRTLQAHFRGWVLPEFFKGAKVRFFADDGGGEVTGVIEEFATGEERGVPSIVQLRVKGTVEPGSPGMWDQGESRIKGGKFYSRVCDDLAGAAGALTMLDQLYRKPPAAPVAVLLTRAEEEGFVGAIASVLKPELLRKTDRIIAIETSAMQPYAKQGDGAILRVGDRTSIFNSALTYFLGQKADELVKRQKKTFKYQRALMPGGTCEATVYDVYGYTAASICVALGNYHNMDRERGKIGPEYIDLADWQSMVKWFVHLAKTGHEFEPGHGALRERIEKRFDKLKKLL